MFEEPRPGRTCLHAAQARLDVTPQVGQLLSDVTAGMMTSRADSQSHPRASCAGTREWSVLVKENAGAAVLVHSLVKCLVPIGIFKDMLIVMLYLLL